MTKLIDRAAEIEQTDDLDVLWASILSTLGDIGLHHVVYLSVDETFEAPFVRNTIDGLYDGYPIRHDPFLKYACDSYDMQRIGTEFLDRYPYINEHDRNFIEHAGRLGFLSGFAIPTRLPGFERFGGFVVGTGLDLASFQARLEPFADDVQIFCILMHRRLEELQRSINPQSADHTGLPADASGAPAVLDCLTPREKEVIRLLAQGRSRLQTAHICDLSIHTVSDYAKSAYRKLGVHNRAEAAALINKAQT